MGKVGEHRERSRQFTGAGAAPVLGCAAGRLKPIPEALGMTVRSRLAEEGVREVEEGSSD